jgi:hypothetical protein
MLGLCRRYLAERTLTSIRKARACETVYRIGSQREVQIQFETGLQIRYDFWCACMCHIAEGNSPTLSDDSFQRSFRFLVAARQPLQEAAIACA